MNHSLYISKRWKQKRKVVLRHYNYEDQEAKRYGQVVTATMVHHIYPVTVYPELRFTAWNLLPLSNMNHNKMHDRTTNEITDKGKFWQKKRKREFEKFIKNKKVPPSKII